MTITVGFLSTMVTIALAVTILAPVVLLWLWIKDMRRGQLW